MLETILQLLITGVALGFVYALVGVEYTLVWQSSGLLNVAHNMLITTAAFVFGDHLGFTAGFDPEMLVPVILGKLVGGVTAIFVAMAITGGKHHDKSRA